MRIIRLFTLTMGLLCCLSVKAELISTQEAFEASDLDVTISATGNGYVMAKRCAECPFTRLEITPATSVRVNGETVPADRHLERTWSGGAVIFDTETKQIVNLILF
jgi:hypothetical protein